MQVVSDQTWTGRQGPILHDSVYNGEAYDARNERIGWTSVGFNDSLTLWIAAQILPSPLDPIVGQLVLQDMPPIRAGVDALHFETNIYNQDRSYLKADEISEIQGRSLAEGKGSVLKPIALWRPTNSMSSSL